MGEIERETKGKAGWKIQRGDTERKAQRGTQGEGDTGGRLREERHSERGDIEIRGK